MSAKGRIELPYRGMALRRILEPFVPGVIGLSPPVNRVGLLVVDIHVHGGRAEDLFDEDYKIRRGLKIDGFRVFVRFGVRSPNSMECCGIRELWLRKR